MLLFLAWAWLAKAKGHSCHTKNQLLPKTFTKKKKKTSKSAKYPWPLRYKKKKKRSVEITMHLSLDNIIKFKFTTNFDRCAVLNVLNCLTKNFQPLRAY